MTPSQTFDIRWWNTSFSEEEAVAAAQAVRTGTVSQGPSTLEFEEQLANYLRVRHVIATTNGTAALVLSLLACNVKHGDEVILPGRTWVATAHAVAALGATPVFVDCESERPIMDVGDVERKITSRTRVIVPVHLNGRAVSVESLRPLCADSGIHIVEDSAQALGSKHANGDLIGGAGDLSCFSLSVAKVLTTGQGGFIATNDDDLAHSVRMRRTHGVENTIVPRRWEMLGLNFRYSDILASMGLVSLTHLSDKLQRLRQIHRAYATALVDTGLHLIPLRPLEVGPYVECLSPRRDDLVQHLANNRIESRPFYPDCRTASYIGPTVDVPEASRRFQDEGVYLPSGPTLTDKQIEQVVQTIQSF